MQRCTRCKAEFEPGFDICWNCGADAEGFVETGFRHADAPSVHSAGTQTSIPSPGVSNPRSIHPRSSFPLPAWVVIAGLGLAVIVLAILFPGRNARFSDLLPAYLFGSLCILGGIVMMLIDRSEKRKATPTTAPKREKMVATRPDVDERREVDYIVQAIRSDVPATVLIEQMSQALQMSPSQARSLLRQFVDCIRLSKRGEPHSRFLENSFTAVTLRAFESDPGLIERTLGSDLLESLQMEDH